MFGFHPPFRYVMEGFGASLPPRQETASFTATVGCCGYFPCQ
jgi:hypothetical protein